MFFRFPFFFIWNHTCITCFNIRLNHPNKQPMERKENKSQKLHMYFGALNNYPSLHYYVLASTIQTINGEKGKDFLKLHYYVRVLTNYPSLHSSSFRLPQHIDLYVSSSLYMVVFINFLSSYTSHLLMASGVCWNKIK